jgi:hypothetical protein
MRRALQLITLVALIALPTSTSAATLVLDSMTEAFDPNPCLPSTLQPVIFRGSFCDGATCPPGTLVSGCAGSELTTQFELTGILQDGALSVVRQSKIDNFDAWSGSASAQLRPEATRVDVSTTDPEGSIFYLRYGSATWHLNLADLLATHVRVLVQGDISPSRSLYCTVQMIDRSAPFKYASSTVVATGAGILSLPITGFFTLGGFDFTHVDDINFVFQDCQFGCSTGVPAREYAVGPITIDAIEATSSTRTSWGRLKTLYR